MAQHDEGGEQRANRRADIATDLEERLGKAMATAGTPPSNRPSSARMIRSRFQFGMAAQAMVQIEAPSRDTNIRLRRPNRSDTAAAQKMASARKPVDSDRDSELAAGLTPKSRAKIGMSGWTQ